MSDQTRDPRDSGARLAREAAEGFPPDQIGEPRPGPGRPPLPDDEARSESIVVRVTPGDKARLVALADATGQAQSDLVRSALHRLFVAHDLLDDEGSAEAGDHALSSIASTLWNLESRLDEQLNELRAALTVVNESAGHTDGVAPEDSPV